MVERGGLGGTGIMVERGGLGGTGIMVERGGLGGTGIMVERGGLGGTQGNGHCGREGRFRWYIGERPLWSRGEV